MKPNPFLTSLTKITLKWAKDLSVKPETITFLEENKSNKLLDTGLGNDFMDMIGKSTGHKSKAKEMGPKQPKKASA